MPSRREAQGLRGRPVARPRPAIHDMIGQKLRLHYDDLQMQPLPARLRELLVELERLPEGATPQRRN